MCLITALKYCKGIYAGFVNESCRLNYYIIPMRQFTQKNTTEYEKSGLIKALQTIFTFYVPTVCSRLPNPDTRTISNAQVILNSRTGTFCCWCGLQPPWILNLRHSWTANGGSRFPKTSVPYAMFQKTPILFSPVYVPSVHLKATKSFLLSWREARPQLSTVQPYRTPCVWHVLQYSYLFAVWHV